MKVKSTNIILRDQMRLFKDSEINSQQTKVISSFILVIESVSWSQSTSRVWISGWNVKQCSWLYIFWMRAYLTIQNRPLRRILTNTFYGHMQLFWCHRNTNRFTRPLFTNGYPKITTKKSTEKRRIWYFRWISTLTSWPSSTTSNTTVINSSWVKKRQQIAS